MTSKLSLTTPTPKSTGRALSRLFELDDLPARRAYTRADGKFLLTADVSRFYPSIYTHSIPWVLHGKHIAKARKNDKTLLGNELDSLLRNCQDLQTSGIPVGPDTSLVIAEILLSHVDRQLSRRRVSGFRYIDDYELTYKDEADAFKGRSTLQELLQGLELSLGPAKTAIHRLPQPLREEWLAELRRFPLSRWRIDTSKALLSFFDRAFALCGRFPNQGILKYAAGRASKLQIERHIVPLAEDLLIQCARVEAGALAYALAAMLKFPQVDAERQTKRQSFLNDMVTEHAPQRHSSEVSWSLWAMLALDYSFNKGVVSAVVEMNDPVCALLALHAKEKKLVTLPNRLSELRQDLNADSLYGDKWLLAYEATRKGWFRFPRANFVAADVNFGPMLQAGVSFYSKSKTLLPSPPDDPFSDDNSSGAMVDDYISQIVRDYDEDDEDDEDDWDDDDDDDDDGEADARG